MRELDLHDDSVIIPHRLTGVSEAKIQIMGTPAKILIECDAQIRILLAQTGNAVIADVNLREGLPVVQQPTDFHLRLFIGVCQDFALKETIEIIVRYADAALVHHMLVLFLISAYAGEVDSVAP